MKAILISIKPEHLVNILNGKKTIEIRKNKSLANAVYKLIIKKGYAEIYVYCCYGFTLSKGTRENELTKDGHLIINKPPKLNGKVVCSFKCYKVEEIFGVPYEPYYCDSDLYFETNSLRNNKLLEKSCLNHEELENYLNDVSPYGYAIHISDLKIFDKPKELSEFEHEIMIRDNVRGISHEIVPVHRVNDWLWIKC